MPDWTESKRWSDRFLPEIKRILGEHLISEAPIGDDAERATDLMVLTLGAVRVGCRVRQWEYLERYGEEFTIRATRTNGAKTELAKIIEGWGDYLFYGFADQEGRSLARWLLGDLRVFRLWHSQELRRAGVPGSGRANGDGSSTFRAYRVADLPTEFVIVASNHQKGKGWTSSHSTSPGSPSLCSAPASLMG